MFHASLTDLAFEKSSKLKNSINVELVFWGAIPKDQIEFKTVDYPNPISMILSTAFM